MKLKPCPFCGGVDIGIEQQYERHLVLRKREFKPSTLSEEHQVFCRTCGCGTGLRFYLEDAFDAWNRRANNG